MSESSIVGKLRAELVQEITTERQVVYILAEIRKLLELRQEADAYFALDFYCCWALHVEMDREGATRIVEDSTKRMLKQWQAGKLTATRSPRICSTSS